MINTIKEMIYEITTAKKVIYIINELPINKVALFIPDYLNNSEIDEVTSSITHLLNNTHFHFSFYRTITEDFLMYLLNTSKEFYPHFTLHFISSLDFSDRRLIKAIEYAKQYGVKLIEHNLPVGSDDLSTSNTYDKYIKNVISYTDETLVFFKRDNKQTSKMMRPLDITKELNKKGYIKKIGKKNNLIKV